MHDGRQWRRVAVAAASDRAQRTTTHDCYCALALLLAVLIDRAVPRFLVFYGHLPARDDLWALATGALIALKAMGAVQYQDCSSADELCSGCEKSLYYYVLLAGRSCALQLQPCVRGRSRDTAPHGTPGNSRCTGLEGGTMGRARCWSQHTSRIGGTMIFYRCQTHCCGRQT